MSLTTFIRDALKATGLKSTPIDSKAGIENDNTAEEKDREEFTALLNSMDGMGTGTARFVIERKLPDNIGELYHIEGLENKGRYYLAKIIGEDGRIVNQLLVDKQNATIHFLKAPIDRIL